MSTQGHAPVPKPSESIVEKNTAMTEAPEPGRSFQSSKGRPSPAYRYDQTPAVVICPHCKEMVTTDVIYKCGLLTWSVSAMLCLTGCWVGCCLIPFCMKQTKDSIHVCPNCKNVLGVHRNC